MPPDAPGPSQVFRTIGVTLAEGAAVVGLMAYLPEHFALAFQTQPGEGMFVQVLDGGPGGGVVAAISRINGFLAVMDFRHELLGASGKFDDIGACVVAIRAAYGVQAGNGLN
jgi:hypothetical protein